MEDLTKSHIAPTDQTNKINLPGYEVRLGRQRLTC